MPRATRRPLGRSDARLTRRAAIIAGAAWLAGAARAARPGPDEPDWLDQRQLGPFLCRADFPLRSIDLEGAGLGHLERELRRVLAIGPCRDAVEVLLVRDEASHRRLVQQRHPNAPYRRALFVKRGGQSTIYAYLHPELAIDLRHEGTHALLHGDLAMTPLWLDEGLAEYFEAEPSGRARGDGHYNELAGDLKRGRLVRLETLEAKHELASLTAMDYRFAWGWTHFLLHGPREGMEQLGAMLAAIRRREPPGALSARLRREWPDVAERFVAHFRYWPRVLRDAERRELASRG